MGGYRFVVGEIPLPEIIGFLSFLENSTIIFKQQADFVSFRYLNCHLLIWGEGGWLREVGRILLNSPGAFPHT